MANTPEDSAARILGLFQAHSVDPDEPQAIAGLKPLFVKDGFTSADMDAGIRFAVERGWLERGKSSGTIVLTVAGASAMSD